MTSIVLITGATGGIGRALSRQLHAQGLRVAAVGRDANRLADVEAHARIVADTTTPEGAAHAVSACRDLMGASPSLLAHCVGSTLIAPLHRTQVHAYREVMRVNLDSAVFTLQAWIAALQGEPGAAVLASSVVARIGVANHEAIAAAKGGVEALVRSTAATYASAGAAHQRGRTRNDRDAHDGQYAQGAGHARGRRAAVSPGWGSVGRAGGRCDGLPAGRRRCPTDRTGRRRGRRVHHGPAPRAVRG